MTVQNLIEKLQNVKDKSQQVEVSISQYNKIYPVAYCDIHDRGFTSLQSNGIRHRIEISLPQDDETFSILSKRKK